MKFSTLGDSDGARKVESCMQIFPHETTVLEKMRKLAIAPISDSTRLGGKIRENILRSCIQTAFVCERQLHVSTIARFVFADFPIIIQFNVSVNDKPHSIKLNWKSQWNRIELSFRCALDLLHKYLSCIGLLTHSVTILSVRTRRWLHFFYQT